MSTGYTKLFSTILDSTVWGLSKESRLLWITMLVKKNRDQIVRASVPGLARAAILTVPETEAALEDLKKPDPYSQSKEHEGRRILDVDGGWFVVNGEKYRNMLSEEERKEYKRQKQAQYRAAAKEKAAGKKPLPGEAAYERAEERGDAAKAEYLAEEQP